MKSLDKRTWAFVVTVWEERRDIDGACPEWRASVDDIRRGTRVYFDSFPELYAYLRAVTGVPEPASKQPARDHCTMRRSRRR
jgi:hypothetical protein